MVHVRNEIKLPKNLKFVIIQGAQVKYSCSDILFILSISFDALFTLNKHHNIIQVYMGENPDLCTINNL